MLPFLTDSDKTSVDIGANKGTYTCHLATLTKHVYAYEPNPAMRQFLTRIIPENVSISDRAISDETGEAILNIPRRAKGYSNNIGTLDSSRFDGDVQRVAVPQRPLDDEGLTNIGFMKIDVEGLELAVLRGATQTILHERPNVVRHLVCWFYGGALLRESKSSSSSAQPEKYRQIISKLRLVRLPPVASASSKLTITAQ